MPKKNRTVVEKISRKSEIKDSREFDIKFWQKLGPEAIFAAAWEMVEEVNLIRGKDASESRLQRNIQRRKS